MKHIEKDSLKNILNTRIGIKNRLLIVLVCICLLSIQPLFGEDVEKTHLQRFVSVMETSSPTVLHWKHIVMGEEYRHRGTIADKFPTLSLGTSSSTGPGYSVSNENVTKDGEEQTQILHSTSAGIYLSQEIPTSGEITLGVHDTFSADVPEEGDTIFLQDPELRFTYIQPFAANGRIIDPRLYSSKYNASETRLRLSRLQSQKNINASIIDGLDRLLTLETLQYEAAYIRYKLEVLEEEIRFLKISLGQGKGTQSEVWEKELERDNQQEQLLSLSYSIEEAYHLIERLTGIGRKEIDSFLPLIQGLPEFRLDPKFILKEAFIKNPDVRETLLEKTTAEHQRILSGGRYCPQLHLSFSLQPQYPQDIEPATTFSDSIRDFNEEGGWTRLAGSININIPIYTGRKIKYENLYKDSAVSTAVFDVEEKKRGIAGDIDLLFLQRELFEERYKLYTGNLQFAEKELENTKTMLELKRSTPLNVQRATQQVLYWKAQRYGSMKDIFLIELALLDVSGADIADVLQGLDSRSQF